jgi:hypothetical protein
VKIAFYHNIGANLRNNYQYEHRFREKIESIFGFVAQVDKNGSQRTQEPRQIGKIGRFSRS